MRKLEMIYWDDITSDCEWRALDNFEKYCSPSPCISVGFVVKETKECVWLAGDVGDKDSEKASTEGHDLGNLRAIPKGVITRRLNLRTVGKSYRNPSK